MTLFKISRAPLRFHLLGQPWQEVVGDEAVVIRYLRTNRPRRIPYREARNALAGSLDSMEVLLILREPLASVVLRDSVGIPGCDGLQFRFCLHPNVRFEVPPAVVPGTTLLHEDIGGRLEPDALDRLMAEIYAIPFAEGL